MKISNQVIPYFLYIKQKAVKKKLSEAEILRQTTHYKKLRVLWKNVLRKLNLRMFILLLVEYRLVKTLQPQSYKRYGSYYLPQ